VSDLTPRQYLELQAARAVMAGGPMHPTLSMTAFGKLTEEQLRELIAWHEQSRVDHAAS
jgi:hypothetical protein